MEPKVDPLAPKLFPPLVKEPKALPPLFAREENPGVPEVVGEEPKPPLFPVLLPNAVLAVSGEVFPNPPKPILPDADGLLNGLGEGFIPEGDPKFDDIGTEGETPN